jgi:ABC-2 type transport system permease protein
MKARRIWAVARKEFIHVRRDARSLGMAIAIPMLLLVLFGYALTLDVDHVPLLVWDQNRSPASRELISRFAGSRYFAVGGLVDGYDALERAMDEREVMGCLVIPSDFSGKVGSGRPATVQLLLDGTDANTAAIALGYAEMIVQSFSRDTTVAAARRAGARVPAAPLDLRPRVWFNADLESRNYIIPGLIAVIMMIIAALLTSLTVAREWERGTMEQLIATPVRGSELILGKLMPYFALGMADVLVTVLLGEFLFHVPLRGSPALLVGMAGVFLAGGLALGLLISVVARGQLLATQMAMVGTFLPAFLLSGFMFSIANMPAPIQLFTYLVPARYFVALLKGIYLKGVGLEILAGEALLLAAFALVVLLVANAKFRKVLH